MTGTLPANLQAVLDDLEFLTDRRERIDYLISLGESYSNFPPEEVPRTDNARVAGCESEVYFAAAPLPEGGLRYRYAVDNAQGISAMAMAKILDDGLSGVSPQEVEGVPEDLAMAIFGRELSMGKGLGLGQMIRMAKDAARKSI